MAEYGDLVGFSGPIEMTTAVALPHATWENQFATHNSLTVPEIYGQPPLISGNVATEEGGGRRLTEASEAHMVEVDFSGNVALESTSAGGATHGGTFKAIKSFGSSFVINSAPNGRGGAVHTSTEAVVEIIYSNAFHNTAKSTDGFSGALSSRLP